MSLSATPARCNAVVTAAIRSAFSAMAWAGDRGGGLDASVDGRLSGTILVSPWAERLSVVAANMCSASEAPCARATTAVEASRVQAMAVARTRVFIVGSP